MAWIKWTEGMEKDLSMLFPYMTTWKVVKVLNKKHNVKLTKNSVDEKAYKMKLEKDSSDGMTITDICEYLGEKSRDHILYIIKKEKIKTNKSSVGIVISFSDFDYLKNKYTLDSKNTITIEEAEKISGYSKVRAKFIIRTYNVHRFIKPGDEKRTLLINKEQFIKAVEFNLNRIKFCYINNFRNKKTENDIEEYYSVGQAGEMLGVSQKLISKRCKKITDVHPGIKYVKGKGGCMPTARIPMRAIEAVFDKLNEGWSYKGC